MKYFIVFVLLFLLLSGCGSDLEETEQQFDYSSIDVVTGLSFYDFNGSPIGLWRSPNDKRNNGFAYPNPCQDELFIFTVEGLMKEIWLTKASCFKDTTTTDIEGKSELLSFNKTEIEEFEVLNQIFPEPTDQLAINMAELTDGFYKLFYETTDGNIFWQNIYRFTAPSDIQTMPGTFLDSICE